MKQKAFTLIEVLVTVVIIGLLVVAATINYNKVRQRSRDIKRKNDIMSIAAALDSYYLENKHFPDGGCDGSDVSWPDCQTPWINNLDEYLNPMPSDPGPNTLADGTGLHQVPCDGRNGTQYAYWHSGGTNPTNYILLARLELDDPEAIGTIGTCPSNQTIGKTAFQQVVTGNAIFAVFK